MDIRERRTQGVVILHIEGKVMLQDGSHKEFRQVITNLLNQDETWIILNMSEVGYIDSAGTGELVSAYQRSEQCGGRLALLSPTEKMLDHLKFVELLDIFDVYDFEDEAIASFNS